MTRDQAWAEFMAANEAYVAAKQGVSDQQFAVRHGMPNTLAFAEMVQHTAYHNWLRAHERFAALQPAPAPKPVVAPVKSAPTLKAAATPAKIAPPVVRLPDPQPLTVPEAEKSKTLLHLEARCEESENRVWAHLGFPPVRRS